MNNQPESLEEIQSIILDSRKIIPYGFRTKPGLILEDEGVVSVGLGGLCGISEYNPDEFVISAFAGTRISELTDLLSQNNQYIPFDPVLTSSGASVGGCVSAGISGSGRYHYGGIRDFLLGVKYINSRGQLIRGGGKVVKNAAGFDLAKLMVGSLGTLGILTEATFKVFPIEERYATLVIKFDNLESALDHIELLSRSSVDFDAIDLLSQNGISQLYIRLGGPSNVLDKKTERVISEHPQTKLLDKTNYWIETREMEWVPENWSLIWAPSTPRQIPELERQLARYQNQTRYCAAGQFMWLAVNEPIEELDVLFKKINISGLVIKGQVGQRWIGKISGEGFYRRIKPAMDPENRFLEI